MRSNLDSNKARGLIIDGPLLCTQEILAITANQVTASGMPFALLYDPGNTGRNVALYTPQITGIMHKHEIWNFSTGTGVLTVQQVDAATTACLVAPGQRAEVFWDTKAQLWRAFPQTNGITNTVGSQTTFQQYTTLAGIANSQVIAMAIPFAFKLVGVGFRTKIVASTASKLATLTAQVNGVSVTGGVISLTTANQNTSGGLTAGTAITAGNVGTAGQSVGVLASAVTAFVEGDGYVEYTVQNNSVNA